jgi:hypothetical protein
MVLYLHILSWPLVLVIERKYAKDIKHLRYVIILQSYLFFGCAFAVLGSAFNFSQHPECNHLFVVTLFQPFPLLPTSRKVLLGLFSVLAIAYTGYILKPLLSYFGAGTTGNRQSGSNSGLTEDKFDGKFATFVACLIICSALHIANIELLRARNEEWMSQGDPVR